MTSELETKLMEILGDKKLTAEECLHRIMYWIIDLCEQNRPLFNVLLVYLINLQKTGASAEERVNRRVIRVKHLLSMIIIEGQKRGEFQKLPVKSVNNMLYSLVESSIFEIAVLNKKDVSEVKASIDLVIQGILK